MRLSRSDWTQLALRVLGEEGPEALTVATMCARAGKTRGSLYHHFPSHGALVAATLGAWEVQHTDALIAATPPGGRSSRHLHDLATALDVDLEQAVRRLVARSPDHAEVVQRVDAKRVEHLHALLVADGLSETDARARAEIEYAAFLGLQQLRLSADRVEQLFTWLDGRTGTVG